MANEKTYYPRLQQQIQAQIKIAKKKVYESTDPFEEDSWTSYIKGLRFVLDMMDINERTPFEKDLYLYDGKDYYLGIRTRCGIKAGNKIIKPPDDAEIWPMPEKEW
jgi:hypothetical protein